MAAYLCSSTDQQQQWFELSQLTLPESWGGIMFFLPQKNLEKVFGLSLNFKPSSEPQNLDSCS